MPTLFLQHVEYLQTEIIDVTCIAGHVHNLGGAGPIFIFYTYAGWSFAEQEAFD